VDSVDSASGTVAGTEDACGVSGTAAPPRLGRRLAGVLSNGKLTEVSDVKTFVALDAPGTLIEAVVAMSA
jgi:hypothetical protein